jgi:ectoine hydroxylase-related dioxygenase (phytanoyl-CoA dioxygenase family)
MTSSGQQRAAWLEEGYLVLRGFFDEAHVAALETTVDRVFEEWLAGNRAACIEHSMVNMHSLTSPRYFEGRAAERIAFFDAIAPRRLTELLDSLFGGGIHFHNTQLFFNPLADGKLPYWHRDLQFSPIADAAQAREQERLLSLHLRIPLLHERGVELIPGSHRRWDTDTERDVRFETNGRGNSERLPGSVLIELARGDVLMFDAQMIHRGNYRLNRERRAFDICVGKAHPFITQYLDGRVLPAQEEIQLIANSAWYRRARAIIAGETMY